MKFFTKLLAVTTLILSTSCAMLFNDKEVDLSIDSTPRGANIIIGEKNYGQTPKTIKIKPDDYDVFLIKEGYGSTQFKVESWVTARNGKCIADALGSMLLIPYYSFLFSGYCDDFKEKEHMINIPYQGTRDRLDGRDYKARSSLKVNPSDIDYYYGQDVMKKPSNSAPARGGYQLNHKYRTGY